jgi:hypothetical protein
VVPMPSMRIWLNQLLLSMACSMGDIHPLLWQRSALVVQGVNRTCDMKVFDPKD